MVSSCQYTFLPDRRCLQCQVFAFQFGIIGLQVSDVLDRLAQNTGLVQLFTLAHASYTNLHRIQLVK